MKCDECVHLEESHLEGIAGRQNKKVIGYCSHKEKLIGFRIILNSLVYDYPEGCNGFSKRIAGKNGVVRVPDWIVRWWDKFWRLDESE